MQTALNAALVIYAIAIVISMLVGLMIKLLYRIMQAASKRKEP